MKIENVKLTKVYINDTKKDGTKLLTKDGRPYKKIAIQTDKHAGYLSDFIFNQDDRKLQWQVGDEVEIIVWQNGEYKNFKAPTRLDRLEMRMDELEELIRTPDGRSIKEPSEYPEEDIKDDIKVEDLPF